MFEAYGGMGGRGVSEAKAKLKEMMTPEYWQGIRFQTRSYLPPGYPTVVNEMRVEALRGYAFVQAKDFDKLAQAFTSSIDDLEEREKVERQVEGAAWLNREYRKPW